jgi:hypothetical protein
VTAPTAECELHETSLPDSNDFQAFSFARKLLDIPMNLQANPPICFYLLHFPDGRDVFLIHNDHTLMDIGGACQLLMAIQKLAGEDHKTVAEVSQEVDFVRTFLRRFPLRTRISSVAYRISQYRRIAREPAVNLVNGQVLGPEPKLGQGIIVRMLADRDVAAFRARVSQLGGLPSPPMVLLASLFRALDRFAPGKAKERGRYTVTLGTDLRGRRAGLNVGNMASVLLLSVTRDQLADRDALVRDLVRQKNERVKHGYEVGSLQLASWFCRFPGIVRRRIRRTLAPGPSLVFGYIACPPAMDGSFCGAPIDRIHQTVSVPSPPGFALVATEFADKVTLTATYTPSTVAEDTVNRVMDFMVKDVTGAGQI